MSDNSHRREYFKIFDGEKLFAKVPLSWKESFSMGVVNPHRVKNCNECIKHILCDGCVKSVNQTKEISANLNELGRPPPDENGRMLPWYLTI